jgi:MFS family permease
VKPQTAQLRASHTRYWVVLFAVTLAILAYIDRVCISQAAPVISADLGFSKSRMGAIFGAFTLAYSLFEIPGGWMGDWMGPRRVLTRIVLWWSAFTAATGLASSFWSLAAIRFLFGAGEAGCFPNLTKVFTIWLPFREQIQAQGILWTFARWGGAFTPPLVIVAFRFMSWRWAFLSFGGLGVVWAACFFLWYRDNPRDHPQVNAAERELLDSNQRLVTGHVPVPWRKLFSSRSVVLLWVQYFCLCFPWYFYITWLPTYLQEYRKLSPGASAGYAGLPLLFGGFGCLFAAFLARRMAVWSGSVGKSRRLVAYCGFLGAASMLLLSIQLSNPAAGMIAMGFAGFCNDLIMPPAWAACMDIGGRFAGTVSGSMNMMGNFAGFVAPVLGGYILDRTHGNWNLFLYLMAGMYVAGTLCWPLIDTERGPIEIGLAG